MRYLNLVAEVRKAARLSKPGLAKRLNKSGNLVAAWELDPQPEEARQLAQLARENNRPDLAIALLVMAGDSMEAEDSDILRNLRGDEQQLAEWVVSLYRDPRNEMERAAIQLLWGLLNQRAVKKRPQSSGVDGLSAADKQVLEEFLQKKDAIRMIAAIASGGDLSKLPEQSEKREPSEKKYGERMAK